MNVEYITREVKLNYLTGSELSTEVEWLVNYFKDLIYSKKEEGDTRIFYKNWDFLKEKYGLNHHETRESIKGMLELTLNRKVDTPRAGSGWYSWS